LFIAKQMTEAILHKITISTTFDHYEDNINLVNGKLVWVKINENEG